MGHASLRGLISGVVRLFYCCRNTKNRELRWRAVEFGFVYGLAMAVAWVSFGVIGGLCLGKFLTGFRGDFRLQELVVSYHDRLRDLGRLPGKTIGEPDGAANPDSGSLRRDR